ncbi:MAG: rhombotarget lipoprotein [Mariprofundaceae bacterium]|nr:rhombotarget lipoprotein [Mariprofundaceae bacterium]
MRIILCALLVLGVSTACVTNRSDHYSSSVVKYLYPKQAQPIEVPEIPYLPLPLRVGIAFVPDDAGSIKAINEERKVRLMQTVKKHFSQYKFVKNIEIIPSAYLQPKGSFANVDQMATMFGLDVIVLLSYDQSRFTGEGLASITYWTLIGAYIVPGEKNDTHTMVDAAVYDVVSHKMLFRAPGVSHIHSTATPINLSEQLRKDAQTGFTEASADLIVALDKKLQAFREKVKTSPKEYRVEHRSGYGGGAMGWFNMLLLIGLMGVFWRKRHDNA